MIRTADNDLEILYNYYLGIKEDEFSGGPFEEVELNNYTKTQKPTHNNSCRIESRLTYFMIDFYGKNGFPQVVSDKVYSEKLGEQTTLYRGEWRKEFAQNLVNDQTYHFGAGASGEGIYLTDDKERADVYSSFGGLGDVVEYKIHPNAKIISLNETKEIKKYVVAKIQEKTSNKKPFLGLFAGKKVKSPVKDSVKKQKLDELVDFLININDSELTKCFTDDSEFYGSNLLAVYLGYDCVKRTHCVENLSNVTDYIVLNRNALILRESEYNRLMGEENHK